MDRQAYICWTRTLLAAAALLPIGCGRRPVAPPKATVARAATPPPGVAVRRQLAEPSRLILDDTARPLADGKASLQPAGPKPWPAAQTANHAPAPPPKIELGPPSDQPGGAATASDRQIEGPSLSPPNSPPIAARRTVPAREPIGAAGRSPLAVGPPPSPAPPTDAELELVNQQANQRVQQGFQLAGRGATYSGRAEFTEALWMVAEALDSRRQTDLYGRSLSAALAAGREAGDFAIRRHRSDEGINLDHLIAGHRTTVLKGNRPAGVNALRAQQIYLSYAQEQFSIAAGRQNAASEALYGLGRLAAASAAGAADGRLGDVGLAATYYQAALSADERNFRAANELGVLFANHGRLPAAVTAFQQCLRVSPEPAAWRNLAAVHARLGEQQLAESALAQANLGPQSGPLPGNLQWLDPSTFAQTATPDALSTPGAAKAAALAAPAAQQKRSGNTAQRSAIKRVLPR